MSFFGKEYKLDTQENFDGFLNSVTIPEDFKKTVLAFKPTTKLTKNGDTYTLSTTSPDNTTNEVVFKSGVEFDEKVRDVSAKTTFTVDGNTVTQVQKFPDGVTFTFKREFSDNELVATVTNSKWDGVAKRYYKAL